MNIGNKKQAIGLSIVAVLSVSFLAKTLFSTFSGGKPPVIAKEINKSEGSKIALAADPAVTSAPQQSSSEDDALAFGVKPLEGIQRDVFSKNSEVKNAEVALAANTPPPVSHSSTVCSHDEGKDDTKPIGRAYDSRFNTNVVLDPGSLPTATGDDKTRAEKTEKLGAKQFTEQSPKTPLTLTSVAFIGFFDAGRAAAIFEIASQQLTVGVGEEVFPGCQLVKVSMETATVRLKGRLLTLRQGTEQKI